MFTLPDLPYSYDALEPHFDAETMEIHHAKHHQGYVNKANKVLEKAPEWLEKTPEDVLRNLGSLPRNIQQAALNQVGGVDNHSFFWQILSPDGGGEPSGKLAKALEDRFGSFQKFQDMFNTAAASHFGSGWVWLVKDPKGILQIVATNNQASPISSGNYIRLFNIDLWEHAYYLKYQNKRPEYIKAFWNVLNWRKVEALFEA